MKKKINTKASKELKRKIIQRKKWLEKYVFILVFFSVNVLVLLPSLVIVQSLEQTGINNKVGNVKFNFIVNDINKIPVFKPTQNTVLKDIIQQECIEDFSLKVTELLKLKYPTFVVEAALNKDVNVVYNTHNEYLEIIYSNHIYEKELGKLTLKVYYNEIKSYLSINPTITANYINENGYEYDPTKKTVALTFDDGPSYSYTSLILNELETHKARATFFMLGLEMQSKHSVIKEVSLSGNEIGLHGFTHTSFNKMSLSSVQKELTDANEILFEVTGEYATLVRPPYGQIKEEKINELNYSFINWNVDPQDWRYKDVNYLTSNILNNVEDGSIILLHDIFEVSLETVKKILPELYLRGYQVVDVSTLASIKGETLKNNEMYRYIQ